MHFYERILINYLDLLGVVRIGRLAKAQKIFHFVLDAEQNPPYKARSQRVRPQKILGKKLLKTKCFCACLLG